MYKFSYTLIIIFLATCFNTLQSQEGKKRMILPDALYEIRYWQDMANLGQSDVLIDTMVYFGNDRAGFEYTNAECVSYHCRDTDSLIYTLLPKLFKSDETEWTLGDNFVRKMGKEVVPFRTRNREIQKVYVSETAHKSTGIGNYSLLSKDFGVVCRWNSDGEFYQLIRIDVVKGGELLQEIDLLPMFDKIYRSSLFAN